MTPPQFECILPDMREETDSIYGKPKFGLIVGMFAVGLIVFLIAALLFFRSGHPVFHTQPQPKNNKGLVVPMPTAPRSIAA